MQNTENEEETNLNFNGTLEKWDPDELSEGFELEGRNIIISGKSGSGKSYLVFHLINEVLSKNVKPDFIYIMSNSEASLDEYKEKIKVSDDVKVMYLKGYFNEIGTTLVKKIEKIHHMFSDTHNYICRSIIIIDDAINILKDRHCLSLQDLFLNGRKRNISCFYICQSLKFSDSSWKENVSYNINFGIVNSIARKLYIQNTLQGLGGLSTKEWEEIFLKYAKGHQCIVIDQTNNENDPKKIIKYFSL